MADAGPGRIVSNAAILKKREEFYERGLFILMGLPNATSVQQEMDQLYGPFKSATYARSERVVQTKLKSRGMARRNGEHQQAAALSLDFIDLATIVNGSPDDPIKERPLIAISRKRRSSVRGRRLGLSHSLAIALRIPR